MTWKLGMLLPHQGPHTHVSKEGYYGEVRFIHLPVKAYTQSPQPISATKVPKPLWFVQVRPVCSSRMQNLGTAELLAV